MARFSADPRALVHILDLPPGTEITGVLMYETPGGHPMIEFETTGGGLPDREIVLEYTTKEDGGYFLSGISEV